MIEGIGIDIIEVDRVRAIAEKNARFLDRVFTRTEIQYCRQKKNLYQHLAARFAAKEAFFKALGRRISWKDVGIRNLSSGKPELEIQTDKEFSFARSQVSISHLKDYAVAVVILES